MKPRTKARTRLVAQRLVGVKWVNPVDAMRAFGLMQGQDQSVFSSIALRSTGDIADVAHALESQEIVRGYPMRGTVFAAPAEDLRWMTELLANPGIERARTTVIDSGGSDSDIDAIRHIVLDKGPVTNAEFKAIVTQVNPEASARILYRTRYLLMVEGTLAYLGRDQRIGPAPTGGSLEEVFNGDRQAAANEIIARYIRTHGPVTLEDIVWWSKLPKKLVQESLRNLPNDIETSGEDYLRAGLIDEAAGSSSSVLRAPHLLPAFDEYILGYKDRLFAMSQETHEHVVPRNMGVFRKPVVVDGVVRGSWRKVGDKLVIEDVAGIPAYAEPGIRRKFRDYPFF
ncbi:winged helix DNA-binding domain-containing protein [Corynebacterium breve]|uniref:Winged helix DNA-binding domain-containing protein n=1 Tax=Corynebacterium breve TaxID=3049799 RepID=A0ABY8VGV3_9CORY|nr:winged helix DNA-binding domain-containing protein [Corynebacterium breve]WIM68744.1 winged helix DNA-binding domain-containing protein [Corynebacterium breve]